MLSNSGFIRKHLGQNSIRLCFGDWIVKHLPGILKLTQTTADLAGQGVKKFRIGGQRVERPAGDEQRLQRLAVLVPLFICRFCDENPLLFPLEEGTARVAPALNVFAAQILKNWSLKEQVRRGCFHHPTVAEKPNKSIFRSPDQISDSTNTRGFPPLAKVSLEKHNGIMAMNLSAPEALDVAGGLSQRFLRSFKGQVEDWYDVCRRLALWEERRLVDEPTSEDFQEHAQILAELERTGRWLALVAQNSDFPDRATAELVAMTLTDLTDRRALWHGTMTPEQREKALRSVFDEP